MHMEPTTIGTSAYAKLLLVLMLRADGARSAVVALSVPELYASGMVQQMFCVI